MSSKKTTQWTALADPYSYMGRVRAPVQSWSVCVSFPAEWINNKSFCCLVEAAQGDGQKPQRESALTKNAYLIGFKY